MNKIINLLVKHIEKIILAVCMVILIMSIAFQLKSLKGVRSEIEVVKQEADSVKKMSTGKNVQIIDETIFDLMVDVREIWKPSYTLGKWSSYRDAGNSAIFSKYRKPPASLHENFRSYLDEFGPGSFFDPPLYVFPIDQSAKLIAFESTHSFESPYRLDTTSKIPIVNENSNTNDTTNTGVVTNVERVEPGSLVRLARTNSPSLPFIFMTAMGEQGTFKIKGRQRILNMGDVIPGTQFTFVKINTREVDWKKFHTAVVKNAENQEILMPAMKKVSDPYGQSTYDMRFFPKVQNLFRKKDGQTQMLSYAGKTVTYQIQATGKQVALVELRNGEPTNVKFVLKTFRKSEYLEWVEALRARRATPETP